MFRIVTATVASCVICLTLGCTDSSANKGASAGTGAKREVKEPRDPPRAIGGMEMQGGGTDPSED